LASQMPKDRAVPAGLGDNEGTTSQRSGRQRGYPASCGIGACCRRLTSYIRCDGERNG
jgi:hypothetical protein